LTLRGEIGKLLHIYMQHVAAADLTAFGSRLRRLLDRMDREVLAVYRAAGERFEPRWYAVFAALHSDGPLTVGALSRRLGISHAAVSQIRSALETERLVRGTADPRDGRRQVLSLTPRGRETATRLRPLWSAIAAAVGSILAEHAPTLPADLDALERAIDRDGLAARVGATPDPKASG
jgi:DNA-binding MarR family transcriptional regulator